MSVLTFALGARTVSAIDLMSAALEVIAVNDPRRFRRIKHDVSRILIADALGSLYMARSNTCLIGAKLASEGDPIRIALAVVHEATHARLARTTRPADEEALERHEAICVRQQVLFVAQLAEAGYTGTSAWIDYLNQKLETKWWADAKIFEQQKRRLASNGAPQWLVWLYGIVFSPRDGD